MDHAKLLNKVDHTLLAQGATWEEIRQICDDAIRFKTAVSYTHLTLPTICSV